MSLCLIIIILEKPENSFFYFYVNIYELLIKSTCILISILGFLKFNNFLKSHLKFTYYLLKINLVSPSLRFKKRREYNFEILKIAIFTYYVKVDISLKQYQVNCNLVLGDFHMQDREGTIGNKVPLMN